MTLNRIIGDIHNIGEMDNNDAETTKTLVDQLEHDVDEFKANHGAGTLILDLFELFRDALIETAGNDRVQSVLIQLINQLHLAKEFGNLAMNEMQQFPSLCDEKRAHCWLKALTMILVEYRENFKRVMSAGQRQFKTLRQSNTAEKKRIKNLEDEKAKLKRVRDQVERNKLQLASVVDKAQKEAVKLQTPLMSPVQITPLYDMAEKCILCLERKSNMKATPCDHMIICDVCEKKLKRRTQKNKVAEVCPLCKAKCTFHKR